MSLNKVFQSNYFFVIILLVFVAAFGLSYLFLQHKTSLLPDEEQITQNRTNKDEIALIFFGCSKCPASKNKKLPEIFNRLSKVLEDSAKAKGYAYTVIGISNEQDIEEGLKHLNSITQFDEISMGNKMANTALQKYVWTHFDGPLSGATPPK